MYIYDMRPQSNDKLKDLKALYLHYATLLGTVEIKVPFFFHPILASKVSEEKSIFDVISNHVLNSVMFSLCVLK